MFPSLEFLLIQNIWEIHGPDVTSAIFSISWFYLLKDHLKFFIHNFGFYHGQSVPVDCEVFHGRSTITIEHLTGEVKPIEKKFGENIPGGARNVDGMMIVKVCKSFPHLFRNCLATNHKIFKIKNVMEVSNMIHEGICIFSCQFFQFHWIGIGFLENKMVSM